MSVVACVAAPIARFISLEVRNLVEPPRRFSPLPNSRHLALIAVLRMIAVVHSAAKIVVAVKPGSGANKRSTPEPL